jgi:hypothetical protein
MRGSLGHGVSSRGSRTDQLGLRAKPQVRAPSPFQREAPTSTWAWKFETAGSSIEPSVNRRGVHCPVAADAGRVWDESTAGRTVSSDGFRGCATPPS